MIPVRNPSVQSEECGSYMLLVYLYRVVARFSISGLAMQGENVVVVVVVVVIIYQHVYFIKTLIIRMKRCELQTIYMKTLRKTFDS